MVIKPGDTGQQVARLQAALNRWISHADGVPIEPLVEDGTYGEDTTTAVAVFQQTFARRATGWADAETLAQLGLS